MAAVYLQEQGSVLAREGRRLVVRKDGQEILAIPIHRVDRVVLLGRIQITADAAALLLERNVPLVMASSRGRIRGILTPPQSPHIRLRKAQYTLFSDPDWHLAFAKDLVLAKAENCQAVLRRYRYNHPLVGVKSDEMDIQTSASNIPKAYDLETIRGLEGLISRCYFAGLTKVFASLKMGFGGRIRRPPTDPVNAVLSFTYVLLTGLVSSALEVEGLDHFCGVLHSPNRAAPALALDMLEQFRQPFADRFTMLLFNKRILGPEDFSPGPMQSVRLVPAAKQRLLVEWEKFLLLEQGLGAGPEKTSPIQVLRQKAHELRQAILDGAAYQHFRLGG